ncbi:HAD hydrolase family protein [Mycoplasmopsis cynos]|nr:HAD hydrolase family protein [Mycoplasmopsis cynos]
MNWEWWNSSWFTQNRNIYSYDKVKEFYKLAKERKINLNIVDLDRHIEITKPGISKGSGIKWICQNVLNIDVNDVIFIGDTKMIYQCFK